MGNTYIRRMARMIGCFLLYTRSLYYSLLYAQHPLPTLRIGLLADLQYADKESNGSRFYRMSLSKVDSAVRVLNQQDVSFSVILGDLVDEGPSDLPALLKRLNVLKKPYYCLLGNHDYVHVSEPDQLHRRLSMPKAYYSFVKANWRFIFLNTNELSEYSTLVSSPKRIAWQKLIASLNKTGRTHVLPWNGGIGQEQLAWLKAELALSERRKEQVVVLTHHPLLPENGYEALNNRAILAIITSSPAVKMVISGHNHKGGYAEANHIPFVTLEGIVETSTSNAYGILELYPHEIRIKGYGRLTSRSFSR